MTRHVVDALDGQWRVHDQEPRVPNGAMRWRPPQRITHGLALAVEEHRDAVAKSAQFSPLHLPVVKP